MSARKRLAIAEYLEARTLLAAAVEGIDHSFGDDGYAAAAGQNFVTQLPDGKFFVVGDAQRNGANDNEPNPNVTRLNSDGTIDTSFGTDGHTTIEKLYYTGYGVLSGQRVFVFTRDSDNSTTTELFAINLDGTLDKSFGTKGIYKVPVPPGPSAGYQAEGMQVGGILAESDGSLIVSFGYSETNPTIQPGGGTLPDVGGTDLAKITANGQLDTSFGQNGFLSIDPALAAMTMDSQGRLDLVHLNEGDNYALTVTRLHSDGTMDRSFGQKGQVDLSDVIPGKQFDTVRAILESDGKLIITGRASSPGGSDAEGVLFRLNANGIFDNTYGKNGITISDDGYEAISDALAIDSQGRLIAYNGRTVDRFTPDGLPDATFGDEGILDLETPLLSDDIASDPDTGAITIDSSDRIIADLGRNYGYEVIRIGPQQSTTIDSYGTLAIHAADTTDVIAISENSGTIKTNLNGQVTKFLVSAVKRIDLELSGTNNTVSGFVNIDSIVDVKHDLDLSDIGTDSIQTAGGNDHIVVAGEKVTINSGGGDDRIRAGGGSYSINAGAGNDTVLANSATVVTVFGGDGNDSIAASAGNDSLYGGGGSDSISGGPGDDYISSGGGKDHVWGRDGNDTIYGGNNNDDLNGGPGNDLLSGQAGNDKLFAADGQADSVYGCAGTDAATVDNGIDMVTSVENVS